MMLGIDAGNTHISFAIFKKTKVVCKFSIATERKKTEHQFYAEISTILAHYGIDATKITAVKMASVVPEIDRVLKNCLQDLFGFRSIAIIGAKDAKLKINLSNPEEVGVDRVINVFAAFKKYGTKKNVLIIDFGTAVTFDIGLKSGSYEGGVIYPGINLSLEALRSGTSKLPKVSLKEPKSVVGKSTVEAINAGIFYGYSGMVNSIVEQIQENYSSDFKIILTGGLASILADYFNFEFEIDEMLTLEGIVSI